MALIGLRLFSGVMGGGKSYAMAEIIFQALSEGAQVHTNLDLNYEDVKKRGWESQVVDLRGTDIKQMHKLIRAGDEARPNVLALDEASLFFYVDEQNSKEEKSTNRDVLQFLTWARRFGLEVYFATQSPKNINVKLRRMSEYTIRCTNTTQLPFFGWLLSSLRGEFKRATYLCDEDKDVLLATSYARFDKRIGEFYFTHGFAGQQEKQGIVLNKMVTRRVPKRMDQRHGKMILAGFVTLGVSLVLYLFFLIRSFMYPDKGSSTLALSESDKAKIEAAQVAPSKPLRFAKFVSRSPRLLVQDDSGRVFYGGAQVERKTVKFMAEHPQWIAVTYNDKTTDRLLLPAP